MAETTPSHRGSTRSRYRTSEFVASRLRSLRRQMGLSLADVGRRIVVDKSTVWRWENQRAYPYERNWDSLEQLFGSEDVAPLRASRREVG